MRIGLSEFLVIIIAVIALIKPDKLAEYSRAICGTIKTIKNEKNKIETEISGTMEPVDKNTDSDIPKKGE